MNENRQKAAKASARGNMIFFASVMLSMLCFAFAVTSENGTVKLLGWIGGGVLLVAGAVSVFLHSRIVSRYAALAAEEEARLAAEKKAAEDAVGEDGLSASFCAEMRGYSAAQLRLILDEQEDEYTPEEFAYIKKMLASKEEM